MNKEQYCLSKIADECNEIAIECHKICQFGPGSFDPNDPDKVRNSMRLRNELNDLMGALAFFEKTCGFRYTPDDWAILRKCDKMTKYLEISQDLGYVEK